MAIFEITKTAGYVTINAIVQDLEAAKALVAQFPKSYDLNAVTMRDSGRVLGVVTTSVKLAADAVNGGQNETGLKRIAAIERKIVKLGHSIA